MNKQHLALRLAFFILPSVALAGGNIPGLFVPAPPPTLAYVGAPAAQTVDAASFTFTSAPIGTATADRLVIVSVNWSSGTSKTISSVTIGGVVATIATNQYAFAASAGIVYALVPSGTTGDIVVTMSGTIERCQVGVWIATGLQSITPTATAANTTNALTITVQQGGFAIANKSDDLLTATTWTNATENFETSPEGGMEVSGASTTNYGSVSISTTNDASGNQSITAAAFR